MDWSKQSGNGTILVSSCSLPPIDHRGVNQGSNGRYWSSSFWPFRCTIFWILWPFYGLSNQSNHKYQVKSCQQVVLSLIWNSKTAQWVQQEKQPPWDQKFFPNCCFVPHHFLYKKHQKKYDKCWMTQYRWVMSTSWCILMIMTVNCLSKIIIQRIIYLIKV